jgi:hypothetical protein
MQNNTIKSGRARPNASPRGFPRSERNHESPGPPLQAQCHRLFRLGCVAPEALHAPGAWGACLQLLSRRTPNMRNTSRNARLHDIGRTPKWSIDDAFTRAIWTDEYRRGLRPVSRWLPECNAGSMEREELRPIALEALRELVDPLQRHNTGLLNKKPPAFKRRSRIRNEMEMQM